MLNLPDLSKGKLEDEAIFDVDALPDMGEEAERDFLDILQERKKLEEVRKKHELPLPKDESEFKDAYYKQDTGKLTLQFKLSKADLQNMAQVTYGLFSTDVNSGEYEFEIADTEEENVKELYYYDEFSGEIVDGKVKIYKRYFFTAIVRSLVKQEILMETSQNKFSINPVFFIKLQVHSASVAAAISHKGFPVADMKEFEKMRQLEEDIKAPDKKENIAKEDDKASAKDLF